MNRKVSVIVGLLVTVLAITAILVCFASAFGADADGLADTRGNVFQIMFGYQGKNAVPLLIVAFVLQCVGAFFALLGAIVPGKLGGINLAAESSTGLQLGIVNISKHHEGLQLGLVNINSSGFLPCFPGLNFNFSR